MKFIDTRHHAADPLLEGARLYVCGQNPLSEGQVWTFRLQMEGGFVLCPKTWAGLAQETDAGSLAMCRKEAASRVDLLPIVILDRCPRPDCQELHANLLSFDAAELRRQLEQIERPADGGAASSEPTP